ncbi:MAG TPA: GNAT family N-acetyltransferase [Streptosporangiaceae bacterium]
MSSSCQPEPDGGVYALLIDGTTVLIRPARAADFEAVRQMHAEMSPDNVYLRFFSPSKLSAAREARRVTRPPGPDHCGLLVWLGSASRRGTAPSDHREASPRETAPSAPLERLVGVASYEPAEEPGVAEIAFAVTDDMHGRGVATLLLDHLVSTARLRGLRAFKAQTLAANSAMLRVFANAGLAASRRFVDGVIEITFPLPVDEASKQRQAYQDSVAMREQLADVASLRHLLSPSSVAVVGASRRPSGVGYSILRNIVTAGFAGQIFAVNRHGTSVTGVRCVATAAELPEPPDVAVIAVPAASVVEVAGECGRAGARSLVVVSAGIDADAGAELLATCRAYGMRLVGPNCFGIAVPGIGLNATFAGAGPAPGIAGLVMQSGGIGIALLEHLSRLGIGVSSFASVGDKFDVSSNDLLVWWEQDQTTRLAVLYVESFGSPRRFAKTARRVGRQFPVLTVIGGRSAAGRLAAASHTAAAGTPLISQEALFGQAGVIATTTLGELVDAAALLAAQPLPAGTRVGIVTNAGGAAVLAADACGDNGLRVAGLAEESRRRLLELLPGGSVVAGPVDTMATVSREAFGACLEVVARDDEVDAVMAITVRTALGDLAPAVATAEVAKPLVAVALDQEQSITVLPRPAGAAGAGLAAGVCPTAGAGPAAAGPGAAGPVPSYLYPESAARALGHAARYAAWLARDPGSIPELPGVDLAGARAIAAAFLAGQRLGGWLADDQAAELIGCYGIGLAVPGSTGSGIEVLVGTRTEPVFGPIVIFGIGGAVSEVLDDKIARLTPLTDTDADEMIKGLRAAPLLLGERGIGPVDLVALRDLLLRVSRLADDLAELAELELNPVIARPDGAYPAGARIRLAPADPADPFLRRLR